MKKIFVIMLLLLGGSAFAMLPPADIIARTDRSVLEKTMREYRVQLGSYIYDIFNVPGATRPDVINCMDWALYWYLKFNGGKKPIRARLIANDKINHLFIGVNVYGYWEFIDAGTCSYMRDAMRRSDWALLYDARDNYDVTEYVIDAYTNKWANKELLREARKRRGVY